MKQGVANVYNGRFVDAYHEAGFLRFDTFLELRIRAVYVGEQFASLDEIPPFCNYFQHS